MAKRVAKKPQLSTLLTALNFLSLTFSDKTEQSSHAFMEMGSAYSYNMIIGLYTPIDIDLAACPQIDLFREAVERAGPVYAVTQLSANKIFVKSDEFHAYIPCVNEAHFQWPVADPIAAQLGSGFISALDRVMPFCDDKSERLLCAAIQIRDGSILATTGSVVIEAWHGFSMPDGLLIPKIAAKTLHKIKKELIGFGFSNTSITFHFADGCWMRSQLFVDKLPDIRPHIDKADKSRLREVPHDFFEAVEKVAPFSTTGRIWVEGNRVSSHPFDANQEGSGLSLQFTGVDHAFRIYGAHDLHTIRKLAMQWNEHGRDDGTLFFGDKLRGMIWHEKAKELNTYASADDDDIPF